MPTQRKKRKGKNKNGAEEKIPEKVNKVEMTGYIIEYEKRTSTVKHTGTKKDRKDSQAS